jgi:hypothetical protein
MTLFDLRRRGACSRKTTVNRDWQQGFGCDAAIASQVTPVSGLAAVFFIKARPKKNGKNAIATINILFRSCTGRLIGRNYFLIVVTLQNRLPPDNWINSDFNVGFFLTFDQAGNRIVADGN